MGTPVPAVCHSSSETAATVLVPQHASYIRGFDGLRAFAITAVIAFHLLDYPPIHQGDGIPTWLLNVLYAGNVGVDLFFVLSGFLITGILLQSKEKTETFGRYWFVFGARRALRILPAYYAYMFVAYLTAPDMPEFQTAPWITFLTHPLPVNNWWMGFGLVSSPLTDITWSLAIEEQFYFFWPFAVWFLSRAGLKRLCVALIVFAAVFRPLMFMGFGYAAAYCLTPSRFDSLALGALAYLLWSERNWIVKWVPSLAVPLGTFFLFVTALGGFEKHTFSYAAFAYVPILVTGVLLVLLVRRLPESKFVEALEWKPLVMVGRASYSIYLWHRFAIAWTLGLFHAAPAHPSDSLMMFVTYLVLVFGTTGILAYVSYWFERWWLSFKSYLPS